MLKKSALLILLSLPVSSFAIQCPPLSALSYQGPMWILDSTYKSQGWYISYNSHSEILSSLTSITVRLITNRDYGDYSAYCWYQDSQSDNHIRLSNHVQFSSVRLENFYQIDGNDTSRYATYECNANASSPENCQW